ncbi:CGNR zinc finger domain-containing protein [Nocardiopsis mangrovi]|uniref:CGNR zinc finger domain-containing protein n=1 Tax=Nocardiopsis mangrovi TaxID=1179818 RepID=A0ABV9DVS5_9ACTN
MAYSRPAAPGALGLIEAFGNSARRLHGEDALSDTGGAREWLRENGWPRAAAELDEQGRAELVEVREAVRAHLADEPDPGAPEVLNAWSDRVLAAPRWSDAGGARIAVAASSGVREVLGAVLSALAAEELAGRGDRLKVCRSPDCRWLFYDRSPANNSVWCSMSTCGARHKMRSYRTRKGAGSPPGPA